MTALSALVVATGAPVEAVAAADRADLVVAADGGIVALLAAGRSAHIVIGDADSAPSAALDEAAAAGAEIRRHPAGKDESDLELALAAAVEAGATSIEVVAGDGGRLDHQLANLAVLASPRWSATIRARIGEHRVWVVRGRVELPLAPGDHVALQAVGGPADDVRTAGLRYPLDAETLDPFAARGIANEVVARPAEVEVGRGVVLAISSPTPSSGPDAAR